MGGKWNFALGMSFYNILVVCHSADYHAGYACSKIGTKCPKQHPLFTVLLSISIKRMLSEQHADMPFHLSGRWDESHLPTTNNDLSSDTRWLSVICWHHLWVTQDKAVNSKLKFVTINGILSLETSFKPLASLKSP